jgi:exopolysaccharide biosynthesis polyprenyl glycosylphosphotransferase
MGGHVALNPALHVEDAISGSAWSERPEMNGTPALVHGQITDTLQAGVGRASEAWTELLVHAQSVGTGRLMYYCLLKRSLDVAITAVLLVVVAPVLLIVALAVRIDSGGPSLFRQTRIGRGGRPFIVYKFRTMVANPHAGLVMVVGEDGRLRHKVKNDPRITRVGRVLRATSIDELPQLINVVRGEMSLVGPRPELPEIVQTYEPWQHRRHYVKPGITGWWQVQGRSDRPMHEHTELDLYYVENVSFRLDLEILRRTVRTVLSGGGAF